MAVNITDIDNQDWEDVTNLIAMSMDLTRCEGGRFVDGSSIYICPHCGADEPMKKCRLPKSTVRKETK